MDPNPPHITYPTQRAPKKMLVFSPNGHLSICDGPVWGKTHQLLVHVQKNCLPVSTKDGAEQMLYNSNHCK